MTGDPGRHIFLEWEDTLYRNGAHTTGLETSDGLEIPCSDMSVLTSRYPPNPHCPHQNGLVRFQDRATARYGFADAKTGAIIIPARFSDVGGFNDHGLAAAKEGERAGFIHADGQWAFPPRFPSTNDLDAMAQAQVTEDGRSELASRDGKMLATLTHGEGFFHQDGEFAAFRVFPGREEAPTQRFGIWALDATLYAVPEIPSFMPTTTGNVRLSFASDDALVRWRIETEGWVVTLVNEEAPSGEPDVTRQDRLADFPADAETLVALLIRQFEGQPALRIATTPADTGAKAAQAELDHRISANRARYLAQLRTSTPDLARALTAMRTRVSD